MRPPTLHFFPSTHATPLHSPISFPPLLITPLLPTLHLLTSIFHCSQGICGVLCQEVTGLAAVAALKAMIPVAPSAVEEQTKLCEQLWVCMSVLHHFRHQASDAAIV
jgi:hypothetical protein